MFIVVTAQTRAPASSVVTSLFWVVARSTWPPQGDPRLGGEND